MEQEHRPRGPEDVEVLPLAQRADAFRGALEDLQQRLGLPGA